MLWHSALDKNKKIFYNHEMDIELPNGAIFCKHCEEMMRSSNGFIHHQEDEVCKVRLSACMEN